MHEMTNSSWTGVPQSVRENVREFHSPLRVVTLGYGMPLQE